MSTAIYARISEDRAGTALGIDRQLEDCRALAASRGWPIVAEWHDNDLSALKGGRRPGYDQLMADVRAGRIDTIIVWHTSRLWRNRRERTDGIQLLQERAGRIVSVKGTELDFATASGRMVAGILGEVDTAESEVKAERVARAARQRAELGGNSGGPRPYGYGVEVLEHLPEGVHGPARLLHRDCLQQVPAEAVAVRRMFADFIGGVPLGAVVRGLNSRGVPTVSGRPWSTATVRDILKNPRHAGLSEHRGEIVGVGQWEPIVGEPEWRTAFALLADPARRTSTGNRASYLLSGLAICGRCGRQTIRSGHLRRGTVTRRVYRCRTHGCGVTRQMAAVNLEVAARVVARLARPDAVELRLDIDRPDVEALRVEERAIGVQLSEVAALFADRQITGAQLSVITGKLRVRLAEIDAACVHVDRAAVFDGIDLGVGVDASADQWEGLGLDRQRAIVSTLYTVRILPSTRPGVRAFDPESVEIVPRDRL